MILVNTVKSSS